MRGKLRARRERASKASQVKCQATQKMCGMAWQIYLTVAVATATATAKAATTAGKQQQCELKFIWGLTIRKQHRDEKLFGHQAQNLHANKSCERDGEGEKGMGAVCERHMPASCWKINNFHKSQQHTHSHTHTHTHTPCLCTWVNKSSSSIRIA